MEKELRSRNGVPIISGLVTGKIIWKTSLLLLLVPLLLWAADDVKMKLTDSAGVSEFAVQDSTGASVFRVNSDGNVTLGAWQGTAIAIGNGGTGQNTQTAAFDALSPANTKGDIIVNNGTNDISLAVGSNNQVLTADSAQASGVKWAAPPSSYRTLVTLNSDVASTASTAFQDITGLSFNVTAGTTYRFEAFIIYTCSATTIGSRWSCNGPGTTLLAYRADWTLAAGTITINNATAYNTGTTSTSSLSTAGNIAYIKGIFTPSASGTFILRFAPETATASGVVVKTGSTLEWW